MPSRQDRESVEDQLAAAQTGAPIGEPPPEQGVTPEQAAAAVGVVTAAGAAAGAGTTVAGAQTAAGATTIASVPASAVLTAEAGAVVGAAAAALRALRPGGASGDEIFWLFMALKSEADQGAFGVGRVSDGDLLAASERERDYERTFWKRVGQRLIRDLPGALQADDPRGAVQKILDRERRWVIAHHEAALGRARADLKRRMVEVASPEGAYWVLRAGLKHCPTCLAMAAVGWWPWPVLKVVHPPVHPNCGCDLLTHAEAQTRGLMGPEVPSAEALKNRAKIMGLMESNAGLCHHEGHPMTCPGHEDDGPVMELEEADHADGIMVALYPDPELAVELSLNKGEEPKQLHLTLAYLGNVSEHGNDPSAVLDAVRKWAENCPPLQGEISGYGKFVGGDEPVTYASVDLPDLPEQRQALVDALGRTPSPAKEDHGYTPHITLDYASRRPKIEKPIPVSFGEVHVVWGLEDYSLPLGDPANPASLEEAPWDRRFAKGTIWGGRFMPKRGGFSPRVSLRDIMWSAFGAKAPDVAERGSERRYVGQRSPATLPVGTPMGTPTKPRSPQAQSAMELAERVRARATDTAKDRKVGLKLGKVKFDPLGDDSAGLRQWNGDITFGPDPALVIEGAAATSGTLPDTQAALLYHAYRVINHEMIHGVNPQEAHEYFGAQRALEEALVEELAHISARRDLKSEGRWDVMRWLERNPDDLRARGMYQPQRAGLRAILDEAAVPLAERESLIETLKYSVPSAQREAVLGGLLARAQGIDPEAARERVTAIMTRVDTAPLTSNLGVSILAEPSEADHRMRLHAGATVKVGDRYTGVITNAGWVADDEWSIEVEVEKPDGQKVYRYPSPEEVEVLSRVPREKLTGRGVVGDVHEEDKVRVTDRSGASLTGTLIAVKPGPSGHWTAELDTGTERYVMTSESVAAVAQQTPGQGAVPDPDFEPPETPREAFRRGAIERAAGAMHADWQTTVPEGGPQYRETRTKLTTDEDYAAANAGPEVDVANTPYGNLPPDLKAPLREKAAEAIDAITDMQAEVQTLDVEALADEVQRRREGDDREFDDLTAPEQNARRTEVRTAIQALGMRVPDPMPEYEPLEEPNKGFSFDASRYQDPRRSLIQKLTAMKLGQALNMADGSVVTRGADGNSFLMLRPDGSRRRYATSNRLANAEIQGVAERHGVPERVKLNRTDDDVAITNMTVAEIQALHSAQASPGDMTRQQIASMTEDDYRALTSPPIPDPFDPQNPEHEAALQASLAARHRWDSAILTAISMGELDPVTAREARGFYGTPIESWKPLPERTYHVTTASDAIMATGLKTRKELNLKSGKGLGAGTDEWVSLTDLPEMAEGIAAGMIEAGKVARGERTVHEMVAEAQSGEGADRPWIDNIAHYWDYGWKAGDPLPDGLQRMLDDESGVADGTLDPDEWIETKPTNGNGYVFPGWEGVPGTETGQEAGTTGTPGYEMMRRTRAMKMADDRVDFAKKFWAFRSHANGPMDPLFMAVATEDLAQITPENTKIVEVERVNDKIRGTFHGGLSEWRVPSGEAIRPVKVRDPEGTPLGGKDIDKLVGEHWNEVVAGQYSPGLQPLEPTGEPVLDAAGGHFVSGPIRDLLIRKGRAYKRDDSKIDEKYADLPDAPNVCYRNATVAVQRHPELTYVEGYAMPPGVPFPIAHGWTVDPDGNVIDPTWKDGEHYYGIPFKTEELMAILLHTKEYGVLTTVWTDPWVAERLDYDRKASEGQASPSDAGFTTWTDVERRYGELVPTEALLPYLEFDRDVVDDEDSLDLTDSMAREGVRDAVVLDYNPEANRMYLADGNHRVKIASLLGIKTIPVVGGITDKAPSEGGVGGGEAPEGVTVNADGPAFVKPSDLGLPVVGRFAPGSQDRSPLAPAPVGQHSPFTEEAEQSAENRRILQDAVLDLPTGQASPAIATEPDYDNRLSLTLIGWLGDPGMMLRHADPKDVEILTHEIEQGDPGFGPFFRGQRVTDPEPTESDRPRGWSRDLTTAVKAAATYVVSPDGAVTNDVKKMVPLAPGERQVLVLYATQEAGGGLDVGARLEELGMSNPFAHEQEVILDPDNLDGYRRVEIEINRADADSGVEAKSVDAILQAVADGVRETGVEGQFSPSLPPPDGYPSDPDDGYGHSKVGNILWDGVRHPVIDDPMQMIGGFPEELKYTPAWHYYKKGGQTLDEIGKELLGHGGKRVVFQPHDPAHLQVSQSGYFRDGAGAELREGRGSACHNNASELWKMGVGNIVTGFALSDDGIWRPHSWIEKPDGQIVETTVMRDAYYGAKVDEFFAQFFVEDNPPLGAYEGQASPGVEDFTPFAVDYPDFGQRAVRFAEVEGLKTDTRVIAAWLWGGNAPVTPLGAVTIDRDNGNVELVAVDETVRRQGLAAKLVEVARDHTGLPLDRASEMRSEAGVALADTVGIAFPDDAAPLGAGVGEEWWGRLANDLSRPVGVTNNWIGEWPDVAKTPEELGQASPAVEYLPPNYGAVSGHGSIMTADIGPEIPDTPLIYGVVAAKVGGQPAGSLTYIYSNPHFADGFRDGTLTQAEKNKLAWENTEWKWENGRVVRLQVAAVVPEHQRKGIATELLRQVRDMFPREDGWTIEMTGATRDGRALVDATGVSMIDRINPRLEASSDDNLTRTIVEQNVAQAQQGREGQASPSTGALIAPPENRPPLVDELETSDQLSVLFGDDPAGALADDLDRTISPDEIEAAKRYVYGHTQASLRHRGLPFRFTVYRAGEAHSGPTNYSLTRVKHWDDRGGQTPHWVLREDVLVDSNAFFPNGYVLEDEVVARNGQASPALPPVDRAPATVGDLTFAHDEVDLKGTPATASLTANGPDGVQRGLIYYAEWPSPRYNSEQPTVTMLYASVREPYRRQGVMTALVKDLRRRHPREDGWEIDTTEVTPDGGTIFPYMPEIDFVLDSPLGDGYRATQPVSQATKDAALDEMGQASPAYTPGEDHDSWLDDGLIDWQVFQSGSPLTRNEAFKWEIDNGEIDPGPLFRGESSDPSTKPLLKARAWSHDPAVAAYHSGLRVLQQTEGGKWVAKRRTTDAGTDDQLGVVLWMVMEPEHGFDINRHRPENTYRWESEVLTKARPSNKVATLTLPVGTPGEPVTKAMLYDTVDEAVRERGLYDGPPLEDPLERARRAEAVGQASPSDPVTGSLTDAARVYVAEGALKRGGLTGRVHYVPVGKMLDANGDSVALGTYGPKPQELSDWASEIAGSPVKVISTTWWPEGEGETADGGDTLASADHFMQQINVTPETDDLTLLHELAHLMVGPDAGHGDEWINKAAELYGEHISPEARRNFLALVRPGQASPVNYPTARKVYGEFSPEIGEAAADWEDKMTAKDRRIMDNYIWAMYGQLDREGAWPVIDAMTRRGTLPTAQTLYRGALMSRAGGTDDKIWTLTPGDEWDSGSLVVSMSLDEHTARVGHGEGAPVDSDVLVLELDVPEGQQAAFPSGNSDAIFNSEMEVLLPAGTRMVVTDVTEEPRTEVGYEGASVPKGIVRRVKATALPGQASPGEPVNGVLFGQASPSLDPDASGLPEVRDAIAALDADYPDRAIRVQRYMGSPGTYGYVMGRGVKWPANEGREVDLDGRTINLTNLFFDDEMIDSLREENDLEKEGYGAFLFTGYGDSREATRKTLVTHEFGHVLFNWLGVHDLDRYQEIYKAAHFGMHSPEVTPPSRYAMTNRQEFIAEAFADYRMNGEDAVPVSKYIGRVIDEGPTGVDTFGPEWRALFGLPPEKPSREAASEMATEKRLRFGEAPTGQASPALPTGPEPRGPEPHAKMARIIGPGSGQRASSLAEFADKALDAMAGQASPGYKPGSEHEQAVFKAASKWVSDPEKALGGKFGDALMHEVRNGPPQHGPLYRTQDYMDPEPDTLPDRPRGWTRSLLTAVQRATASIIGPNGETLQRYSTPGADTLPGERQVMTIYVADSASNGLDVTSAVEKAGIAPNPFAFEREVVALPDRLKNMRRIEVEVSGPQNRDPFQIERTAREAIGPDSALDRAMKGQQSPGNPDFNIFFGKEPPPSGPATEQAKARAEAEMPSAPVTGIPKYKVDLTFDKPAGGSNGAKFMKDPDGNGWIIKHYSGDEERVATELLANAVYRELGIAAPNAGIVMNEGELDFAAIPDADIDEPPLPKSKVPHGLQWQKETRISTGIIMMEPDGRIWIYEPLNHFGGYEHTFSKGGLEDGLTAQQNAHKELWEEMGLQAEVVGYLGDYEGDTSTSRFYLARRTGVPREPDGGETEAVKLVTPEEAAEMLNRSRDLHILADVVDKIEEGWPGEQPPITDTDPPRKPTKPAIGMPLVNAEERNWDDESEALGAGFVADALTANWDVVGLSQDNILWTDDDVPIRVDQGGTFEMRAQGSPKEYGPVPVELWTMNRPGGQAFGTMKVTEDDMRAQARGIELRLTPERIDELVDEAPFEDNEMRERIRENLKARVEWLGLFGAGEVGLPEPVEGKAATQMLRERDASLVLTDDEETGIAALLTTDRIDKWIEHRKSKKKKGTFGKPHKGKKVGEVNGKPIIVTPPPVDPVEKVVKALRSLMHAKATLTTEDVAGYIEVPDLKALGVSVPSQLEGRWFRDPSFVRLKTDSPEPGAIRLKVLVPAGSHVLIPTTEMLGVDDLGPGEGTMILPDNVSIKITRVEDDGEGGLLLDAVVAGA